MGCFMAHIILSKHIASISELKANPMKTIESTDGETVAILNRNQPAFYAVPPKMYAYLMELAENAELVQMIEERRDQATVKVSLDEL